MTREIHEIPPTPRPVRWRAVLWHWWPVALGGFVFGVYGGLWTLMLFLAWGGKPSDDLLIDANPVVVPGKVTMVERDKRGSHRNGFEQVRVSYDYETHRKNKRFGRSFLPRSDIQVGAEIQVEYAENQPHVSRALGGRIALVPPLQFIFLWALLTPGVLLISIWLLAVTRLRRLMVHGDVGVAEIRTIETLRYVLPTMFRVSYTFRDHRAQMRTASHWVRARSALGERLATHPKHLAVIYARRGNGMTTRLVMAEDFVGQQANHPDPRHSPRS